MIKSLRIIDTSKTNHEYGFVVDNKNLLDKTFNFTDGLNIVVGDNGSGKTSLVDLIAYQLCSLQGGYSAVTKQRVFNVDHKKYDFNQMVDIKHDGQPIVYINPRNEIGMYHGRFDEDFFSDGIRSIKNRKQSSGELSMFRIERFAQILKSGEFPTEIAHQIKRDQVNNIWQMKLDYIYEGLNPSIPIGKQTIILDEPENGFSWSLQQKFWKNIMQHENISKYQIIVVTHSPFALNVPNANYIQIGNDNYVSEALKLFKTM